MLKLFKIDLIAFPFFLNRESFFFAISNVEDDLKIRYQKHVCSKDRKVSQYLKLFKFIIGRMLAELTSHNKWLKQCFMQLSIEPIN